jgi:glycosyltransferase involved in cell wall biosynthesis
MPEQLDSTKPVVVIYAEPLLAPSMTFIRTQAEALNDFLPYYVSPHYLRDGLPLPQDRVVVLRRAQGRFSGLTEMPFKLLGVAPLFVRRLRKLQPVLMHVHFGPAALRALPLARKLAIPLIVSFQGYDATVYDHVAKRSPHYSHRNYVRHRKDVERGSAMLIAVSNFIRDELLRQGFCRDKIVVHYTGVDTELFRSDPSVRRQPIVLFVGRLTEKKGCQYLIPAMAKVQAKVPQVELVIIGDGPLRMDLEKLAANSLRRYRFLGLQPPEVVRQWMNRARVFGAPSLRAESGDAEGYPNTFAEAQSMELPVVSFAADGVREAVAHGETGFLAPDRDTEALAFYLQKLLVDEQFSSRMGEAARYYVSTKFNLRIQTPRLEDLYRQVLEKQRLRFLPARGSEAEDEERIASLDS